MSLMELAGKHSNFRYYSLGVSLVLRMKRGEEEEREDHGDDEMTGGPNIRGDERGRGSL